eukprot:XP_020406661.1 myristoylated alanine-rich C-kinase substrate-like [Zea mays]
MSSVPGAEAPDPRPEGRGQPERVLDPSAGGADATPGSRAEGSVPREPSPTPAARGSSPQVAMAAPGQSASQASGASKARAVPGLMARRTSAVVPGSGSQETSPQAHKRSHGPTDLAPRKALKTASVQAAGAISGPAAQPTLSQGAPPHGAQASHVPGEQVPEAGSSAEAAIVIGEAAGADAVPSLPAVSAMPAPAATAVGTVPVGEHMVAADVESATASAPRASEEVGVGAQLIQAGDIYTRGYPIPDGYEHGYNFLPAGTVAGGYG